MTSPGPVLASCSFVAAAGVFVAAEEVRGEVEDWLFVVVVLVGDDAEGLFEVDGLAAVLVLEVLLFPPLAVFVLLGDDAAGSFPFVAGELLLLPVPFVLSCAACCDLRKASVAVDVGFGVFVFLGLGLRQKSNHSTNQTIPAIMSRETINQIILPITEGRFCSYISAYLR